MRCRRCPRNCKRRAGGHDVPLAAQAAGKARPLRADPRARKPARDAITSTGGVPGLVACMRGRASVRPQLPVPGPVGRPLFGVEEDDRHHCYPWLPADRAAPRAEVRTRETRVAPCRSRSRTAPGGNGNGADRTPGARPCSTLGCGRCRAVWPRRRNSRFCGNFCGKAFFRGLTGIAGKSCGNSCCALREFCVCCGK